SVHELSVRWGLRRIPARGPAGCAGLGWVRGEANGADPAGGRDEGPTDVGRRTLVTGEGGSWAASGSGMARRRSTPRDVRTASMPSARGSPGAARTSQRQGGRTEVRMPVTVL